MPYQNSSINAWELSWVKIVWRRLVMVLAIIIAIIMLEMKVPHGTDGGTLSQLHRYF